MKYNFVKIQGALAVSGELKEPIDLPKGTIVLSPRTTTLGNVLVLRCLVPVVEPKK